MLLQSLLRPVLTPLMRGMFDAPIASSTEWSPLDLWPDGIDSPGMWISPRDLTSQWQDSAGTTPVATPGTVADSANPVGWALDIRAGATVLTDPGNHMLQSTAVDRPLLSARVNLLVQTENLANAAWFSTVSGSTITTGVSDPLGGTTAFTITANTTNGQAYQNLGSITIPRIASGYIRRRTGTGVVKFYADGGAAGTDITSQVTASWTPFSVASSTNYGSWYVLLQTAGDAIDVWHPQVESGLVSTQYQRVGAASDYDATGITPFQIYDGTDDGMATASFAAGTLTSSMDCLIAVRRDSAANAVCGLYESVAEANKVFGIAESGSGSGCAGSGAGTPTVWVDNVQLTGGTAVTRDTLHTALTAGAFHILEFRGLDLSTWTASGFGLYTSYKLPGARGDIMLYPSTASTTDKDAARQYLADLYGVTLP